MSAHRWPVLLAGILLTSGCDRQPRAQQPQKETRKPVVAMAPIPTRAFEEGFGVGFDLGKQDARPRAKLPAVADVQRRAQEEAVGQPDRTERWQRGFVDGYFDGFRNVATGQK